MKKNIFKQPLKSIKKYTTETLPKQKTNLQKVDIIDKIEQSFYGKAFPYIVYTGVIGGTLVGAGYAIDDICTHKELEWWKLMCLPAFCMGCGGCIGVMVGYTWPVSLIVGGFYAVKNKDDILAKFTKIKSIKN